MELLTNQREKDKQKKKKMSKRHEHLFHRKDSGS